MAFAGMFLGAVFVIIIIAAYVIAFIELIIGIVLACKKKKVPAIILFVLSAIPAVLTVIAVAIFGYQSMYSKFDTYDGKQVTISTRDSQAMREFIKEDDMTGLDDLLDKHPELIYYQDVNHETLLEYGLHDHNVEIMQIAIDHGAEFDAEPTFINLRYSCSLQNFFRYDYWSFITGQSPDQPKLIEGETTDEMIDAARFAVDHGASTVWKAPAGTYTFADSVENWIKSDNKITDKDKEFLQYAREVSPFNGV